MLGGLEGNRQYVLTVKGFNSIGQGPASASVMAKTRKARKLNNMMDPASFWAWWFLFIFFLCGSSAPVLPPGNLLWIQEGNNVSLSWDPVKAKENESDVIGYMVTIIT